MFCLVGPVLVLTFPHPSPFPFLFLTRSLARVKIKSRLVLCLISAALLLSTSTIVRDFSRPPPTNLTPDEPCPTACTSVWHIRRPDGTPYPYHQLSAAAAAFERAAAAAEFEHGDVVEDEAPLYSSGGGFNTDGFKKRSNGNYNGVEGVAGAGSGPGSGWAWKPRGEGSSSEGRGLVVGPGEVRSDMADADVGDDGDRDGCGRVATVLLGLWRAVCVVGFVAVATIGAAANGMVFDRSRSQEETVSMEL